MPGALRRPATVIKTRGCANQSPCYPPPCALQNGLSGIQGGTEAESIREGFAVYLRLAGVC